jgi:GNAT superfamily N-acetyltransferase
VDSFVVRELYSADDPLFLDAMELYVESFPRDERLPLSFFRESVATTAAHRQGRAAREHLIVAESDGRLLGMRWFSYHPEVGLGYFVYLATAPAARSQGVGSRLIATAVKQCELDALALGAPLDAVCFEVERTDLAASDEDRLVREARLDFFAARGAVCVTPSYVQLPISPDKQPVPLNLLAYRLTNKQTLAELARNFCVGCAGYDPDDPAIAAAVRDAGQPRR